MRAPTIALCAVALLVLLPGTALAHASFDVRQLPAGTTQELVLRVPLERPAANDLVEVLVPGAFSVDTCPAADGWTCREATTAAGDTVLTLARGAGGAGDTERFVLVLAAPTAEGVYSFPTIQTYDDGVEASWIGEPGSDQPAPRLQVGDATTEVEFSGDATPHTPTAGPSPTVAASLSPSPSPGPSVTDAPTAAPDQEDDDRRSPFLWLVGGILGIGVLAGAVARYRSVTE